MTLGEEIRFYRKKRGLTQTEFGALFGMSKQAVYSWETGLYSPDISILLKMSDYFQIPICILVGRPGLFCSCAQKKNTDYHNCTSITKKDTLILRAIHALPKSKQKAIETLLNIEDDSEVPAE